MRWSTFSYSLVSRSHTSLLSRAREWARSQASRTSWRVSSEQHGVSRAGREGCEDLVPVLGPCLACVLVEVGCGGRERPAAEYQRPRVEQVVGSMLGEEAAPVGGGLE